MNQLRWLAGLAAVLCAGALQAQEIILKVHHPLPPTSTAQQKVLTSLPFDNYAEANAAAVVRTYDALMDSRIHVVFGGPLTFNGQIGAL